MIKQIKDTARAGVTLVELLVVILIVAILAVSLLPMFQRYVIKAQYASEAIPLVGHIRTQIGLYQYENGKLPVPATTEDKVFYIAKDGNNPYVVMDGGNDHSGSTSVSGEDSFMYNMDLSYSDMMGRRVSPYNVEYAVAVNGDTYGYAIGVFGGTRSNGQETKLPGNSGYAMVEYYFDGVDLGTVNTMQQKGYKFVAEWEKYDSGTTGVQFKFDTPAEGILGIPSKSAMGFAAAAAPTTIPKNFISDYFESQLVGKWKFPAPPTDVLK